jgi:iron(III) transport system permease protein
MRDESRQRTATFGIPSVFIPHPSSLILLFVLFALFLPVIWPLAGALDPASWPEGDVWLRLLALARTTAVLACAVLLLCVPAGVLLAVLLERTDLPGRLLFSAVLLATLFIPLPLFTSAWQVVLQRLWQSSPGAWAPWTLGLVSAAWIHAVAGLPWVVLLTALGLRAVERDLEDDALLLTGPLGVLWQVSLPRCGVHVAAAGLWVAVQTATEITVTDVMQVRTLAEEVFTQFVTPEPQPGGTPVGGPLARAVTASLGQVAFSVALVVLLMRHAERLVPPGALQVRPVAVVPLGRWRCPVALLLGAVVLALTAVPVTALLWRVGRTGLPPAWSALALARQMARTASSDGGQLARSLLVAGCSGGLCAGLALLTCWLAREARWRAALLLGLLAITWAMPGPVIGLGLKGVFRAVLDATGWPQGLAHLLWHGPSPAPLMWVFVLRFLPFAVALLWPVLRLLPRELFEAARLDGAGPRQELLAIVWPALRLPVLRTALAVTVLSLGEVSASKLVSTPGEESYAEVVLAQMHYGVTADLAARCLLLLGVVLAGTLAVRVVGWLSLRLSGTPDVAH